MLQTLNQKSFLDQFTEEVILTLVAALREKELENLEEERSNKAITQEKFRMKVLSPIRNNQTNQFIPSIQNRQQTQQIPIQANQNIQKNQVVQKSAIQQFTQEIQTGEQKVQQTRPVIQARTKELPLAKINLPQNLPPVMPGEIDFGKIIFLIKDPMISYIECPEENKNIIIKKAGQTLMTPIILTKEEIKSIIKTFSDITKIPLIEGLLNARHENLELSAIVSDIISPSFILRKNIMVYSAYPSYMARH